MPERLCITIMQTLAWPTLYSYFITREKRPPKSHNTSNTLYFFNKPITQNSTKGILRNKKSTNVSSPYLEHLSLSGRDSSIQNAYTNKKPYIPPLNIPGASDRERLFQRFRHCREFSAEVLDLHHKGRGVYRVPPPPLTCLQFFMRRLR